MKIATIVGTRPELIKLSMVIKKLDKHSEHCLIHTGQNFDFELNQVFFEDLGIREPDYFLEAAQENFAYTISSIISKSYDVLKKVNPDALLVYGDTNSCLSVIVAKRLKIPVFHMESGNRCFDQRVPEELNRKVVDHLSDINLSISEHARKYMEDEGIRPETIIKIGSSMPEVLKHQKQKISNSKILDNYKLKPRNYFVVSIHREENVDDESNLRTLVDAINAIVDQYGYKIIFSIHPRTQNNLNKLELDKKLNPEVIKLKPLGFNDYIKLQLNSFCVISDSGTVSEESSILKFPAVTVRQAHERPEAMDEGTLIMTGLSCENIIDSVRIVTDPERLSINIAEDYSCENVSEKVIRIIYSYVDYINRNTWKKKKKL